MRTISLVFALFLLTQPVDAQRRAIVYTTAESTSFRLTPTDTLMFKPSEPTSEGKVYVFVDPRKTFQPFIGIGGALTDAAAETFAKLPAARQEELLQAYYSADRGIGYTLGRTNIHSCDFSSESYTYVEEGDKDLTSFSIAHDLRFRIPLIRRAMAASGNRLKLFASPWSPPAFMKDNNDMLHGGHLRADYAHSWALYFAKFVQRYRKAGVPVWGITIQNEPMAVQRWESCVYQAGDERDFLKNHLGPVMAQQGLGDVHIMVWDHNRDLIIQRAQTIFEDPEAAKYVWGIGFHWYEDWSGGQQMYENVALVNRLYPDKHILFTEGTPATFDSTGYGRWSLGEAYGRSMIHDFNSGTEGWTDWNILLDERGGPDPRRHAYRRAHLHQFVLLHRPLLEVRPSRRTPDPRVAEPQHAAHHGVREPRRYGGGHRHEPDGNRRAIQPCCRLRVSGDQLAATLHPDGGLQGYLRTTGCRSLRIDNVRPLTAPRQSL